MMTAKLLAAAAALCACSGCIVVADDIVHAGDPLDAHFLLTWRTNDVRTGTSVDCHSAGADTVRVRSRNVSTGDLFVDLFDCGARIGETRAVTAGNYSVSVDLVGCFGDPVCEEPAMISAISSRALYRVWYDVDIDLGHFVFLVD